MNVAIKRRRDFRILLALIFFSVSAVSVVIQAWIVKLYLEAALHDNWEYFSKIFSVQPPSFGPNVYCLDRCVAEMPFSAGWIGISSFVLGWSIIFYVWLLPKGK